MLYNRNSRSMVGQLYFKNKPTNRLTEDKVSSVVNRGSGESDERCQKGSDFRFYDKQAQ